MRERDGYIVCPLYVPCTSCWRERCFEAGSHLRMTCVLVRAWLDPARFLERAAWRVTDDVASDALLMASHYVNDGKDVPRWLFR